MADYIYLLENRLSTAQQYRTIPKRRLLAPLLALALAAPVWGQVVLTPAKPDPKRQVPISRPAVSRHLRVLKQAGLVAERPEGRKVYYRAEPEGLAPLVEWLSHYGVFWRDRFANLRTLLKEIDS